MKLQSAYFRYKDGRIRAHPGADYIELKELSRLVLAHPVPFPQDVEAAVVVVDGYGSVKMEAEADERPLKSVRQQGVAICLTLINHGLPRQSAPLDPRSPRSAVPPDPQRPAGGVF